MQTIVYYDFTPDYGVNACVCGEWDFYSSLDDLMMSCTDSVGTNVILVPVSANSGAWLGYQEGLH